MQPLNVPVPKEEVSVADRIETIGASEASKPLSPRQRPKTFVASANSNAKPLMMSFDLNAQSAVVKEDGLADGSSAFKIAYYLAFLIY